jgi:MFS family permease
MLSKRWIGLVFISLGVALIIVDSTIVNVAIPSIINDIGITSTQAQWVQEIYTLVFAALLLVGGRLADQYGRRRLFLLGTVIFAGASVLAALAGDGTQLIAARAVQGLGGALLIYGIGVGFATAQLTGVVLTDVPLARSGEGSGIQSTSRQVGSALGIAILGTVLFATLGARYDTALADLGVPEAQRVQLVDAVKDSAGAEIPGLAANPGTAAAAEPARVAFTDASRVAALTAAGFLVIGLVASLSLGNPRRRRSIDGSADQSEPIDAHAYPAS